MVRPAISKWTLCEKTQGLLVFAEALQDALFDHAADSYRSPALNLHVSLLEVNVLLRECASSRVKPGSIAFAIHELRDHLSHDPVAPKTLPLDWRNLLTRVSDEQSGPDLRAAAAEALLIRVGATYWPALLDQIEQAVRAPREKKRITELARVFSTEVVLQGFSRDYTYWETKRFFFDTDLPPTRIWDSTIVRSFLGRFARPGKEREVILRGRNTYLDHAEHGKLLRLDVAAALPSTMGGDLSRVADFLAADADWPAYIVARQVGAKDEFGARDEAINRIELLRDVVSFGFHDPAMEYRDEYVVLDSTYVDKLPGQRDPMLSRTKKETAPRRSGWVSGVEILQGGHAAPDMRRAVRRLMEYHESALAAKTHENKLLNLWAALEGLVLDKQPGKTRIDAIAAVMLQALTLRYAADLTEYFLGEISRLDTADRVLQDVFHSTPTRDTVAQLLTCAEYESALGQLLAQMDEFPLLRFRLYAFHEAWSHSAHASRELEWHRVRCDRHIRRIYNARNRIVHSAATLPYIPTLVQSLHSYLDVLAETVISTAVAYEAPTTLPGAFALLTAQCDSYRAYLRNSNCPTTAGNFRRVLALDTPMNDF